MSIYLCPFVWEIQSCRKRKPWRFEWETPSSGICNPARLYYKDLQSVRYTILKLCRYKRYYKWNVFRLEEKDYKLWQEGIDCQEIYLYDYLQQKLNYIHNNPVKEEFVYLPEEYEYSSEGYYAEGKGILDV